MTRRVAILGAGMMGSALSVPLADAGHEVRLIGTHLDRDVIDSLEQGAPHPKLCLELPRSIVAHPFEELETAIRGAELLVLGVSSAGVRWAAQQLTPYVSPDLPILMVSKGLDWDGAELRILPDVLVSGLPAAVRDGIHPVSIAGPCIAGELARRVQTCVVFAGRDLVSAQSAAAFFPWSYYHVWTSKDAVGVEVCAALKNAFAMGIAFGAGLHERGGGPTGSIAMHNYEAAVFAQATVEMRRVVELLGGDPESVLGLPGVGDLDVTCNGGRTGRFGHLLGLGLGVTESTRRMEGATLECLEILAVMRSALPHLESSGALGPRELPLLRHLSAVALDDAPLDMPFARFF
ncbi:MAG TPA: 2-dehydropantoate 2-reductase N-terminal domain-containing protein, partial [Polyangiaceae bacterium]